MQSLFLSGMLRSGTTLIQTLLTNHPELFVAYQPYHQFYLDCRLEFLKIHGLQKFLPLGDGLDSDAKEREQFKDWLLNHEFNQIQKDNLLAGAMLAKGGGSSELQGELTAQVGTFIDIHAQIHAELAVRYKSDVTYAGAKEVLCEEFIPTFVAASMRCILIIRDPRAVIASASFGRYRDSVGDRYPLLMLIRLWRKSAAYWLAYRQHPLVYVMRYEDLVDDTDAMLLQISRWLGISTFSSDIIRQPLYDHRGSIWNGNSSFEDKVGVQAASTHSWQSLLTNDEIAFIEACTLPEMHALGYHMHSQPSHNSISDFTEDVNGVRESYLQHYGLTIENKGIELKRWDFAQQGRYENTDSTPGLFLFPHVFDHSAPNISLRAKF